MTKAAAEIAERCYRLYKIYEPHKHEVRSHYIVSLRTYQDIEDAAVDIQGYDYLRKEMYGLPVRVDISMLGQPLSLIMEAI